MDCDTGHLKDISNSTKEELSIMKNQGYKKVPESHQDAAVKKLKGKKEAYVSLKSGGKLSKLCALWRQEKNKRREKRRKKMSANKA